MPKGVNLGDRVDACFNINGNYAFDNIPVGNYKVYVDIPNLPMDSTREISVLLSTDTIFGNDYVADSVTIYVPVSSVGLEEKAKSNMVLLAYPNPFVDVVILVIETSTSIPFSFELIDYAGKVLKSETITLDKYNKQISIDTKKLNLNAGVYFLKIKVGNEIRVAKLMKY
ncbi:MAG: T9SS type A sorting domain-containing protein [Bacteroidetes bacterium]|nr:T9SS type A sorting domain-containing protein [Bacteroidota bacterium]